MRWIWVGLVGLVACTSSSSSEPNDSSSPSNPSSNDREATIGPSGGGGLPPPDCSEPKQADTVSCGNLDFRRNAYCSELGFNHPAFPGRCYAPITAGTMTAKLRGEAFTATHVGARRVGHMIEITGLVEGDLEGASKAIRVLVPTGTAGTFACGGNALTSIILSERTGGGWAYGPRGTCEVVVTAIGTEVTGTFVANVDPGIEITEGAFSITIGP